jgi:uncharacterized protein (DUF433 family)
MAHPISSKKFAANGACSGLERCIDGHANCCDSSVMAVEIVYPHIVKRPNEPARLERHPRTRVAQIVMDYLGHGWSADEIHRQHPHLALGEIHAALGYYFDHAEEIERQIEEEWREAERLARSTTPSPLWLRLMALKRRNASPTVP